MRRVAFFVFGLCLLVCAGCFPDRHVTDPGYEPQEARRPNAIHVVPIGGAMTVPTKTTITVWFDELMNETSISANFGLYPTVTADSISAIAFDPTNPEVIYAGKMNAGILKSTNGGKSWKWATRSLQRLTVTALAINPVDPQVVYAGTTVGIYKSSDGGSTWSLMNTGLTDLVVTAIRVDRQQPARVFVALQTGGVFRSVDGGATWAASNNGLGSVIPLAGEAFTDLAINPVNGSILYVATRNSRIYKSMNSGDNWSLLGPAPRTVRRVALSQMNPSVLYAATYGVGIYRSTNGGSNWTEMTANLGDLDIYSIAMHPQDSLSVLVGTPTGVYKTLNAGASWQPSATGTSGTVHSLAFHPTNSSFVLAGTTANIYSSVDGGTLFQVAGGVSRQYVPGTFSFSTWQDSTWVISPLDSVTVDTTMIRPYVYERALSLWIANGRQGTPPVDPNPKATKVSFTPSETLLKQWRYEIRINGTFESDGITLKSARGAEDLNGNSLEKDKVSNFTTGW